jgi:hypothetical protein
MTDPTGLLPQGADNPGQQASPAPTPASPQPQTGGIIISPHEVELTFGTQCAATDPIVPFSPEVNNVLVRGTLQMASNVFNFMSSAHNLELTPTTSVQTSEASSTSLTLQVGLGAPTGATAGISATAGSGSTMTINAQSTGSLAVNTRNANDGIQVQLGQALASMQSPVACNSQPLTLGQAPTRGATDLAVGAADFARSVANNVAEKMYHKYFPSRPFPKAYDRTFMNSRRF